MKSPLRTNPRSAVVSRCMCSFLGTLALMLGSTSARSADWSQYLAFDDLFSINFPGEPVIRKTTYKTEYDITLPARIYSAKDQFGTYSVTVVDWSTSDAQHAVALKECQASTGDLRGGENPGICMNQTRGEIGGAAVFAASGILKRGGKVLRLAIDPVDGIEGIGIELLNADQSHTFAKTIWHEGFLYIAEATSPKGAPLADAFPISIQFLDKEGRRIQYAGRYSPLFPAPKRSR